MVQKYLFNFFFLVLKYNINRQYSLSRDKNPLAQSSVRNPPTDYASRLHRIRKNILLSRYFHFNQDLYRLTHSNFDTPSNGIKFKKHFLCDIIYNSI